MPSRVAADRVARFAALAASGLTLLTTSPRKRGVDGEAVIWPSICAIATQDG